LDTIAGAPSLTGALADCRMGAMTTSLIRCPPEAWPALAEVVHAWNRHPEGGVHCLHAASGTDIASHAAELAALVPDEAAFWGLMAGERLVGVFGCEFDRAIGRAWMRGPLAADPQTLDALRPVVEPTLQAALPEIRQLDAFPAVRSALLNAWYAAAGFSPLQVHAALQAGTGAWPAPPAAVERARAPDLATLLVLHEQFFPSPSLGEAAFRRALDAADCALFVARGPAAEPLGYLYVEDHPAEHEAYIHYLGVAPSQRGRGLGKALLSAAAHWSAGHGREHMALTVREDRPDALALYRRTGFVELSTGRHWRKTVGADTGEPAFAST